jgi:hypothetical protein
MFCCGICLLLLVFTNTWRLGAVMIIEQRVVLVSSSDHGDCEGFLRLPYGRSPKASFSRLLVACGSVSCVGCATSGYRLGVWCLLAHEPSSGWIATTRTNLPTSKWTSVKNHYVKLVFIVIDFSLAGLDIKSSTSLIFTFLVISCVEVA